MHLVDITMVPRFSEEERSHRDHQGTGFAYMTAEGERSCSAILTVKSRC